MKFAALIALALVFTGCAGLTDTPPQDPPYCTYDGFTRICDGDTTFRQGFGTK